MREQSCAVRNFVIFRDFRDFSRFFRDFSLALALRSRSLRSRSLAHRASRKIQVCKMTKIAKNTGAQALKLLKYRCAGTKIAKNTGVQIASGTLLLVLRSRSLAHREDTGCHWVTAALGAGPLRARGPVPALRAGAPGLGVPREALLHRALRQLRALRHPAHLRRAGLAGEKILHSRDARASESSKAARLRERARA